MKKVSLLLSLLSLASFSFAQCWQSVSNGSSNSLAIKSDGTLWAWGGNDYGQLGDGTTIVKNSPIQIGTYTDWQSVSCGYHSLAIKANGTLWAWGWNEFGQLGDGTNENKNIPTQIGTATNWQKVVCGGRHTLALKTDGTLWAWGDNFRGQLGIGTNINENSPVQVGTDTDWQSVSCGTDFTLAIKSDGSLWGWGFNSVGQLGNGTNVIAQKTPLQTGIDYDWQSVAGGSSHSIAIKTDGTLWAWGINNNGQLGDGTNILKNSPIQIGTSTNWQHVAGGYEFSHAIKSDGTLWAWGGNDAGQLGDGTTVNKSSPVQIGTDTNWQNIVPSSFFSIHATKNNGTLWAWGTNYTGQLGDGTYDNKKNPVEISCPTTGVGELILSNKLNLFPNPASEILSYQCVPHSRLHDVNYEITNGIGQIVVPSQPLPYSGQINIQQLPRGIYFFILKQDNERIINSFLKI